MESMVTADSWSAWALQRLCLWVGTGARGITYGLITKITKLYPLPGHLLISVQMAGHRGDPRPVPPTRLERVRGWRVPCPLAAGPSTDVQSSCCEGRDYPWMDRLRAPRLRSGLLPGHCLHGEVVTGTWGWLTFLGAKPSWVALQGLCGLPHSALARAPRVGLL